MTIAENQQWVLQTGMMAQPSPVRFFPKPDPRRRWRTMLELARMIREAMPLFPLALFGRTWLPCYQGFDGIERLKQTFTDYGHPCCIESEALKGGRTRYYLRGFSDMAWTIHVGDVDSP